MAEPTHLPMQPDGNTGREAAFLAGTEFYFTGYVYGSKQP